MENWQKPELVRMNVPDSVKVPLKVQGIVIDSDEPIDMERLGVEWDDKCGEPDYAVYQDAVYDLTKELKKLTRKYMFGEDDAKTFFFTDDAEALAAIKKIFPGFPILEVDVDHYPLYYDYRRDA